MTGNLKDFPSYPPGAVELALECAELKRQLEFTSRDYSELRDSFDKHRENELRLEAEVQLPANQRLLEIRRLESECEQLRKRVAELEALHHPNCDILDRSPEGIAKPCNCQGALLMLLRGNIQKLEAELTAARESYMHVSKFWDEACTERESLRAQLKARDEELQALKSENDRLRSGLRLFSF